MHPEDATLMKQSIAASLSVLVEKPLHVRVAEALGWTSLHNVGNCMIPGEPDDYRGRSPGNVFVGPGGECPVPRYDTWWSATGPLIERLGISLNNYALAPSRGTTAHRRIDDRIYDASGPTSLIAVCNLILALKEAGKL